MKGVNISSELVPGFTARGTMKDGSAAQSAGRGRQVHKRQGMRLQAEISAQRVQVAAGIGLNKKLSSVRGGLQGLLQTSNPPW